ncbi:unnamed protein product [Cochlearia groenlandica]
MTDDKTRAKAMKTVFQFSGLTGAEIKGDERNLIEVTGDDVDMIALTNTLRTKVAFAELVSASKVEPPKDGAKKPEDKKPEPCCPPWLYAYGVQSNYPYHPCDPDYYTEKPVYNTEPGCKIM